MRAFKQTIATIGILLLSLPISYVANAESTKASLDRANEQLEQSQQTILQKEKEQQAINEEVKDIQGNVQALENQISTNEKSLAEVEAKISETQKIIAQKKEEIVLLLDKVYAREGIMEKRLVALQHSDRTTVVIETLINSESIGNFFERVGAVATLLDADQKIIDQQEADLKQIEEDKKEIDRQQQLLHTQQSDLEAKKAELEENRVKRNEALAVMQEKYQKLSAEINLAEKEKSTIQSQITSISDKLEKEQAAAKARAIELAKAKKAQEEAQAQQTVAPPTNNKDTSTVSGKEMYVSATAYSHEDTKNDVTYLGYNIKKNPNMKLIAVDPGVIPLGSKVWVEGYGVAIAGDTGGAIIGHKIDVLMPSSAKALQWGRKTVKIVILD
ncbi:3D domain-containing protein [Metabacillus endolithicus]|uniref:3D domain-containing protein n=1 Tax=Metabacillus endolithicus TaxID=1535204 RepID=A0ABW5C4Q3_9BACI|nr:3D domain-containing protein [Metabacillus endolithicus]UPG62050.1 3D domain-containing protein [Metabacillus endolithicus]